MKKLAIGFVYFFSLVNIAYADPVSISTVLNGKFTTTSTAEGRVALLKEIQNITPVGKCIAGIADRIEILRRSGDSLEGVKIGLVGSSGLRDREDARIEIKIGEHTLLEDLKFNESLQWACSEQTGFSIMELRAKVRRSELEAEFRKNAVKTYENLFPAGAH